MRRALLDPRIARLVRQDTQIAAVSVLALWFIFGFVFWTFSGFAYISIPGSTLLVGVLGAAILILNTLSIYALTRRCSDETEIARIYGPEVHGEDFEQDVPLNSGADDGIGPRL